MTSFRLRKVNRPRVRGCGGVVDIPVQNDRALFDDTVRPDYYRPLRREYGRLWVHNRPCDTVLRDFDL